MEHFSVIVENEKKEFVKKKQECKIKRRNAFAKWICILRFDLDLI